jgi:pimeloyl-ACP methyl ester carboxylesterase
MTGVPVREGHVEADGLRIRYLEAGHGVPLVHLPGPGSPDLSPAHDILARRFRVVAFDVPHGAQGAPGLASALALAITKLGVDTFNLLGTAAGGTLALWLALQAQERVLALVLEAPAAIGGEDADLESRLEELATPTLLLLGTRDTVNAPMGRVYTERIPGSHLVFVYDTDQAIAATRPEAFTEVVVDFLERREAFVISRTPTVIHP